MPLYEPFLTAALLLAAALVLGRLFARYHLPKVTGYLLAGVLLGPSLAQIVGYTPLVSHHGLKGLHFLSELGIALILFSVGSHFDFSTLKRYGGGLWLASLLESGLTLVLVAGGLALLGFGLLPSLLMGIMAMNTAPGATQMVIREYQSEGKITDLMLVLIGLNNLLGILLFVAVYHFSVGGGGAVGHLLKQLFGPLLVGFSGGVILGLWEQRLSKRVERQVAGIGIILALIAVCQRFELNLLYASLILGATVINASPHKRRLFTEMSQMDYPIYILFFALAGTHLSLNALPSMGVVGIAYIFLRSVGKYVGNAAGARMVGFSEEVRQNLGMGMLCQAGIAIGLSAMLAKTYGAKGREIQTVILAGVVFFEALGPLLTRLALVRGGEVTLMAMLAGRAPVGILEGFHELVNQFGAALGYSLNKKLSHPSEVPIKMVMRRHVDSIPEETGFDQLLKTMGHSRYDRLPVVDKQKRLVGIIHYRDISGVLFVEELRALVVAKDIAVPTLAHLTEKDTLDVALQVFQKHPDISYLFIYSSKDQQTLAGVLRHNDVLSTHGRI